MNLSTLTILNNLLKYRHHLVCEYQTVDIFLVLGIHIEIYKINNVKKFAQRKRRTL